MHEYARAAAAVRAGESQTETGITPLQAGTYFPDLSYAHRPF